MQICMEWSVRKFFIGPRTSWQLVLKFYLTFDDIESRWGEYFNARITRMAHTPYLNSVTLLSCWHVIQRAKNTRAIAHTPNES